MEKSRTIPVAGMTCANCAMTIEVNEQYFGCLQQPEAIPGIKLTVDRVVRNRCLHLLYAGAALPLDWLSFLR